jgi:hypothetical protein
MLLNFLNNAGNFLNTSCLAKVELIRKHKDAPRHEHYITKNILQYIGRSQWQDQRVWVIEGIRRWVQGWQKLAKVCKDKKKRKQCIQNDHPYTSPMPR